MATAATKARERRPARKRPPLTRERVLAEALLLVDDEGLDALTMRRLGKRLGVEAMSLYNHVDGKAGLEAGIVGLLWEEVERTLTDDGSWRDSLRSLARCLRALAIDHPHAFPLLMSASAFAEPMLRALGRGLAVLRDAGFGDERSAKTLNAVVGYAAGYGAMEISCFAAGYARGDGAPQRDDLVELTQALPPNTPPELVRVARDTCMCDVDQQFEFGLEALLAGLDPECETIAAAK
ncbi:MAG: TetR/AcrR family transcriptional regulator [Solirubrobacterales bacterium]